MYEGAQCRERIPLEPSPANLKRVEQHKAAIELAIYNGTFDYAATFPNSKRTARVGYKTGQIPLSNYLLAWKDRKAKELKASTIDGYSKIINGVLIPAMGDQPLVLISRKMVKESMIKIDASNKRLSNIQSCLRSALGDAVDEELLEVNPLEGWTYLRKEKPKTEDEIDPFSPEEQRELLSAAQGQYRNMIQFAMWTGLRTSELVALEWGDIDWLRKEVRITRGLTKAAKEAEVPKTAAGIRDVKLLPMALEALQAQKTFTYLEGGVIFQDQRYNKPFDGDQAIRKSFWIPLTRKAKVRYRNPYQTRHTYASMMLSAGEHPMWVAKQMGHKDWTMIARVYGRWIPSDSDMSGSKAAAMFGTQAETSPPGSEKSGHSDISAATTIQAAIIKGGTGVQIPPAPPNETTKTPEITQIPGVLRFHGRLSPTLRPTPQLTHYRMQSL
ncbi:integrase [Pseudomonas abietaniphila]|uniref:Integrase n=2 Tax=Pseudomonas abietaniphila TaxID=89065 RepID=A0A1G7Y2E5_9PSED|nr:integrase [Pseudomonas abietaniphila]